MKFKYTHILNDPRAEVEAPLLINDNKLQNRVSDAELIAAAFAALRDSDSLEIFYLSYIDDSKGNLRQVSDCAASARKALGEAERRHMEFIQDIMDVFQSGQVKLETDSDYHRGILQLLEGDVIKFQQRGAVNEDLKRRVTNNSYIYYSYVFHRAVAYLERGKTRPEANDFEDGQICLHLKLDTPYCLVTADNGLKEALEKTISLLTRLMDINLHTTLQVIAATAL